MALVINTNVSSLTAQSNLNKTQSMLSKATEALSSGLKINSAADDAAGYAIAQRFTTQIGGLNQANSNASDAISLAQTAESALSQITSNLQAVRDLAVQSANGTYTSSDRTAINTTVQQYLSEVTRIANQTTFNGQNVLDGQVSSIGFQVGANVGQTISVDLKQGVRASQLGDEVAMSSTDDVSGAFVNSSGTSISTNLSGITIDGVQLTGTASSAQDIVDAINATDFSSNAKFTLSGTPGASISAAVNSNGGIDIIQSGSNADVDAKLNFTGSDAKASSASATANETISGQTLADGDVKTVQNSNLLIARIDQALSTVSTFSSNLGAIQNRFQSTISTLTSQSDNLTSAQSTIQDANFASETADLSKANVLQQAGISVLATANSQPQQILKLLQ